MTEDITVYKIQYGWVAQSKPIIDNMGLSRSYQCTSTISEADAIRGLKEYLKSL